MNTTTKIFYPQHRHDACLQIEDRSFWFKHRNECISTLVAKFFNSGRFIDIGGGNGFVARRLVDDGLDVVMVEPGADGARNAQEVRGIRAVINSSLSEALPQLNGAGAFGAFDVVEHIKDDQGFVNQISDALDPGGLFFSTVPALDWLWSEADDEAGHFRRYTARTYSKLLSQRFDVLFSSYFFAPLILPVALLRSLPYRLGRRSASDEESAAREHGTSGGLAAKALATMLRREVAQISSLKPRSFGTSLIVAARKKGC